MSPIAITRPNKQRHVVAVFAPLSTFGLMWLGWSQGYQTSPASYKRSLMGIPHNVEREHHGHHTRRPEARCDHDPPPLFRPNSEG